MLIGLGALGAAGSMAGALGQETTYQPWSGAQTQTQTQTSDQKLQTLVTDLNALIKKAEAAKAADPNFLADLKKLATRYPVTPSLGASGTVFLYDNFSDGNYTSNPAWKVSAGTWKVDTKGETQGLSSTIGAPTSNAVTGNDVLRAILGMQQQQAPQSTYASIYTSVPIVNTFKMTMKIVSASKNGPLNIGPYQGASAASGYRLIYHPGKGTGLVLQRIVGSQVTQIGSYNDPINLEDNKTHELLWQRESTGKMRVYLDGQQMIIATDTQLNQNFDGWLNVNQGGSYWIREIKVVAL